MGYLGRVGLTCKKKVGSRVNPFLLRVKKFGFRSGIFRVESANSDSFCHVYLSLGDYDVVLGT